MHPYLNFFGREISTFGLMALLGIGAGSLVAYLNCKIKKVNANDPMLTFCMALVGVVVGAKILKPLIRLPDILINWEKYAEIPVGEFIGWFFGETVFYGGLLGGTLAAFIFCRAFKIPFLPTVDLIAPAIPIGHAFGRIGCLLGGCCYGLPVDASHPFVVIYPERFDGFEAVTAPSGVPLLAVPVIEAVGNLLIAVAILLFSRFFKNKKPGQCLALYGIMYGIQRFTLEFFRGDLLRGVVYSGISTSQIISICVIIGSALIFAFPYLKNKKSRPV